MASSESNGGSGRRETFARSRKCYFFEKELCLRGALLACRVQLSYFIFIIRCYSLLILFSSLFLNLWIAFRLWFILRLLKSIYFLLLLPWELKRQQINKNEQTETSQTSSTELENILNVAKNVRRNVLVWTCIILWMIMCNDKSYKIWQRFCCCGSKVVLNRLLSDLC